MYIKNKKSFVLFLIMLCLVRIAMKLLYIDIDTGFYNSAPIFPILENVVFLTAMVTSVIVFISIKDEGIIEFNIGKKTKKVFLICGMLVFSNICIKAFNLLTATSYSVNSIPKPILIVELIAGIIASVSMILSAFSNIDARFYLSIPLWHSLFAIDRYITFKQVNTASDQLLETLFLVFSTIFWSQAVDFFGGDNPNRKRTILFGVESLIIGIPLLIGQLSALFVFKNVSGPSGDSILILVSDCILIVCFIKELIYSQKKF